MPEMRGDELCQKVKNDIDTSHIPVILLTALNTDKNIIDGLQTGADEYVVKPFNIGILRATIANLLANRALLRHRYGNLELNDDTHNTECINCSTDLDWKFIASIKKNVEDNMDNPSFTIDVLCELTFLNCRFSERKIIKTERIAKILVSAIKQSLKARLPRLNGMTDFNRFISQPFEGRKFIAHCYEGEKPLLKDVVRKGEDALVLIGPEGDFSEEEVKQAIENGFEPISLGRSRLRTETAALVA